MTTNTARSSTGLYPRPHVGSAGDAGPGATSGNARPAVVGTAVLSIEDRDRNMRSSWWVKFGDAAADATRESNTPCPAASAGNRPREPYGRVLETAKK